MTERELNRLLKEYGGMVRTICQGILPGQREDSEEAHADTFVKLWRCKTLPSDPAHLRSYIIRTARCCAIDKYRSIQRRGILLPLEERDDAAFCVELESSLESRELIELIRTLPPPDGELFLRHYLYCEPCAMLSRHFGIPESTLRTRLCRSRDKLKKMLRKENML